MLTLEEILTKHGWHCPLEKFWATLDIRIRTERNTHLQEPAQGYAPEDEAEDSTEKGQELRAEREP